MKTFYIVFLGSDGKRYGSAAFEAENQIDAMMKASKCLPEGVTPVKCIVKPNN